MAWYDGTYSCGHSGRVNVIGKERDRQWKIERAFSKVCPSCYKAQMEEQREKDNERSQKITAEMDLPDLAGSEKQIVWANTIRVQCVEKIDKFMVGLSDRTVRCGDSQSGETYILDKIMISDCVDYVCLNKTAARFWIDIRNLSIGSLLTLFYKIMLNAQSNDIPNEVQRELDIETQNLTVRPDECSKQGVVTIKVIDDCIRLFYIKDDDFRSIVKDKKYLWNGENWYRKIDRFSGDIVDREAEVGNVLLSKGFTVLFTNTNSKEMACNATFANEQTKWVLGKRKLESLFIVWYGKNEDLYKKARQIHGAKWNNGGILVPIEFYQEVQDFAEIMGFSISDIANAMITEQIQKESSYNVCHIEEPKSMGKPEEEKLKQILTSTGVVLEDLADDFE